MQSSSDNQSSSLELSSFSVPHGVLGFPGTMIEGELERGGSSGRSRHSSRSPPLLRRQAHAVSSQMSDAAEQEPQTPEPYSFSATQNVLNVGASPQEVLQAQREAANQAAQNVAGRAEILHNVAMHQVEQQAQGFVEDAMSNFEFLRAQVAEANARVISFELLSRPLKLTSRFVKPNLPEFKLSCIKCNLVSRRFCVR